MISLPGFLPTIILLGIVQGFILSALLFFTRRQQPANRILAMLIGLITLACLNIYLLGAAWLNSHILLRILASALPLVLIMPVGPLIWLYVQANIDPAFTFSRKQYIHFYPILIDLFPYITVFVADMGILTGMISKEQRVWVSDFVDTYNVYADIPRWMSLTSYLWFSHKFIQQRNASQEKVSSNTNRWLRQFLLLFMAFQAIWLLYLVPYIIPATRQALLNTVDWYPVFIPLSILIYWLGLKGYLIDYKPMAGHGSQALASVSRLPETTAAQFSDQLQKIMEAEKLYLNPSLQVGNLAQQAGMTAKTVSAVLNQHLNKSFSTFVNEYRIAAFKERIMQQDADKLTIPGIAMECGFSSVATFQRIFKQLTGTTPSRFIQEAKQARHP